MVMSVYLYDNNNPDLHHSEICILGILEIRKKDGSRQTGVLGGWEHQHHSD